MSHFIGLFKVISRHSILIVYIYIFIYIQLQGMDIFDMNIGISGISGIYIESHDSTMKRTTTNVLY